MKDNIVVEGVNVEELLNSIQKMLESGEIRKTTIVAIDVLDGYRHGIDSLFIEGNEVLTIRTKIHQEIQF